MSIVKKLRDHLKHHPKLHEAFEASFHRICKMNIPQITEYQITSLETYFQFMERLLKWVPTENNDGKSVYDHICVFYLILDQPELRKYQVEEQPRPNPDRTWISEWIIDYSKEIGKFLDTPESINEASIQSFKDSEAYHMEHYPEVLSGWKTFNEFFARHIYKKCRPITKPDDPTVIVSPADSTFDGSWGIDDEGITDFKVKGVPWHINDLLQNCDYGERFKGGQFMHAFLNTTDYHRQHAPIQGKVVEAKVIPGLCYLKVYTEPDSNGANRPSMRRKLEADDGTGYQFLQARGLIVIDNPVVGLVAVLPIGMAQVSSVRLSVKVGDEVKKGDEISYFQFGGSDIVVVFQAKSHVKITHHKVHHNVGHQIATAHPREY